MPLVTGGASGSWLYTDTIPFTEVGSYQLWITAEDNAGNVTQVDAYQLEVTGTQQT